MDVYSIVTDRIIKQLEQGYIPWRKPWVGCLNGSYNRISRKPYSILNQLLLSHSGEYATYRQWTEIGGTVKKGEKAEIVVFWKMQEVAEQTDTGEIQRRNIPILRYYNVFHISQIENVSPLEIEKRFDTEPIEEAEKVFRGYVERENINVHIEDGNKAFYRSVDDSITLPNISQFERAEDFYCVAFHECGHSTAKACRCDRENETEGAHFGNDIYSKEELVAEITSSAIINSLGIETADTFKNNCAYIQNWLGVLKNDKKFIVSASSKAEKAVKYILDI